MSYYIDLEKISLEVYKEKLKDAYLPPSRKMLREDLDKRFDFFKALGVSNVKELQVLLKKKEKLAELQKVDCFEGDYLKILLREINSIHPNPNKLKDFTGVSPDAVEILEHIGIKNTVKLYSRVLTPQLRQQLNEETGISEAEILELTKLTDLSRIKWVGATFARMLYDLGIETVEIASKANAEELHEMLNIHSKENNIYRGTIGVNDVKIFIQEAGEIPQDVEY